MADKLHLAFSNENVEQYMFFCPGCECAHFVQTFAKKGPVWNWNDSMDKPTVTPSLLVRLDGESVCHSFVTDGKIQFLADCTHKLAGQTVDIPDWESV